MLCRSIMLGLAGHLSLLGSATPLNAAVIFKDVTIMDGTGGPVYTGSVRVDQGKILAVGHLEARPHETVIEAPGKVLAPGFIDSHSHHDEGLWDELNAMPALSQGITTIVVGQDGDSHFPLKNYFARLERTPASLNIASFVGHATLRKQIMGPATTRTASPKEVARMAELLRHEMEAGALGLSTGLEYEPGCYAGTDELVTLARIVGQHKGRYVSHLRSEDRAFWEAIEEIVDIGRKARVPVHISHLKLAMKSLWGQVPRLLARLDHARREGIEITADVYPYTYWQSTMTVLFPEHDYLNYDAAAFAVNELAPADQMIIAEYDAFPDYVGMTLHDVAELREVDPARALMMLIGLSEEHRSFHGESRESIIATSMHEADVQALMAWPHANICSDGYLTALHPRGRGAFPRFLGRYVREQRIMPLALAVHKVTGLAARHLGFRDRGLIAPGMAADLVLFDPDQIIDHATPQQPYALSSGIDQVYVNGVLVLNQGHPTGRRPGAVIRR